MLLVCQPESRVATCLAKIKRTSVTLNTDTIEGHLTRVRKRLREAEKRFDRPEGSVALLAVSKTQPTAAVQAAAAAGQRLFGESYLQEAEAKVTALADLPLEWHFIGPIQSNKTRPIAALFNWVHSVDRLKLAQRLNDQRPEGKPPLNVCLQVNVSGEATKSGASLDALPELAAAVSEMPHLHLRGLMAIPAPEEDPEAQRRPFRALREALESLRAGGLALDTLSMGMSGDLEAAVAEGATIVRIGSAIFGPRRYPAR
jgi:pyridoxal phosphate enzyme (YggS family)